MSPLISEGFSHYVYDMFYFSINPDPQPCPLPLIAAAVPAGFPSPAEDFVEGTLDLNEHLIHRPAATFIVRVKGDSMTGVGIFPGDLLIVDRSLEAKSGSIVIAVIGGELTVKRLHKSHPNQWSLVAENPHYPPITLGSSHNDSFDCMIWGVVASAIHQFEKR
jgi:DNA polymerase V